MEGEGKRRDVEKERYWRKLIREAARSGVSTRQFCPALRGEVEEESVLLVAVPPQAGKRRQHVRVLGTGTQSNAACRFVEGFMHRYGRKQVWA